MLVSTVKAPSTLRPKVAVSPSCGSRMVVGERYDQSDFTFNLRIAKIPQDPDSRTVQRFPSRPRPPADNSSAWRPEPNGSAVLIDPHAPNRPPAAAITCTTVRRTPQVRMRTCTCLRPRWEAVAAAQHMRKLVREPAWRSGLKVGASASLYDPGWGWNRITWTHLLGTSDAGG